MSLLSITLFLSLFSAFSADVQTHQLASPADALSVSLATDEPVLVRAKTSDGWSDWRELEVEDEQDPLTRESNLVVFPESVEIIQTKGENEIQLHPIAISRDPVRYEVAATRSTGKPRILTRAEWGADESLLYRTSAPSSGGSSTPTPSSGDNGEVSERVQDCLDAQLNYPDEFKTVRRTTEVEGKRLRWAHEYSKSVELIAVHHTAIAVNGDDRSGVERVRALYAYHANNRGWGDVGYHYLIDEDGQVYEGKAGGRGVVGGHVYCNNVGSVGIAMLGNFETEEPTQDQMKSLQWLIDYVADVYDIDPDGMIRFHGEYTPTVVGHGDLVSTECPGYYVRTTLDQVRDNIAAGDLYASIDFPPPPRAPRLSDKPYASNADARRAARLAAQLNGGTPRAAAKTGLLPVGSTVLEGRPGAQTAFSMQYVNEGRATTAGSRIGSVSVADRSIGLWQDANGERSDARRGVILPQTLRGSDSAQLRMVVQFPTEAGTYTLNIGPQTYTLKVSGRRNLRARNDAIDLTSPGTARSSSSRARQTSSRSRVTSRSSIATAISPVIRVRLSYTGNDALLTLSNGSKVHVLSNANGCIGSDGKPGVVRSGGAGITTIDSWDTPFNTFRGTIECRVIDGQLVLINELPLEEYMWGLAEEPDTEPYEKQRAFAIAARTYAAWYMRGETRKFPGMPYDGSDSPAIFQAYKGAGFEDRNPRWVESVKDTAGEILTYDKQIIKPPYFSQSDGMTRSPADVGWGTFPYAHIFAAKPDPWCQGMERRGHGVGMSGCGAEAQANEGKTAEQILSYYYPGTAIGSVGTVLAKQ